MPNGEDRLRRALERAAEPVSPPDVEDVRRRKEHYGMVRRVQTALVAVAVVAGAGGGVYGLSHLFGEQPPVAGDPTPQREPEFDVGPTCAVSTAEGEFDGEAGGDIVGVYLPGPPNGGSCPSWTIRNPDAPQAYRIAFFTGDGARYDGSLEMPNCQTTCYILGATDLNGDGREEVAVAIDEGASTTLLQFYGVVQGGVVGFDQVSDPYDLAGMHGASPDFTVGGTVTHQDSFTCDRDTGTVVATRVELPPESDAWQVEIKTFDFDGHTFELRSVERETPRVDTSGAPPPVRGEQCLVETATPTITASTEPSPPAGGAEPWTIPSFPPECHASSAQADFDGNGNGEPDGRLDLAIVMRSGCSGGEPADEEPASDRWSLRVMWRGGASGTWGLPTCADACRVFAAPDLNRDGLHELVIAIDEREDAALLQVFALPMAEPGPIVFTIAPPGAGEEFPQGARMTLPWGGTSTHQNTVECTEDPGGGTLVTAADAAPAGGENRWNIRRVEFRFDFNHVRDAAIVAPGDPRSAPAFVPTGTASTETVHHDGVPLQAGPDFCGAFIYAP